LRWPRDTLYQLKLALTSPAGCGRSLGIVRLRTKTTEFSFYVQHIQGLCQFRLCTADHALLLVAPATTAVQSLERSYAWPLPSLTLLYFLCRGSPSPMSRTFAFSWFCITSAYCCIILFCNNILVYTEVWKPYANREPVCALENLQWFGELCFPGTAISVDGCLLQTPRRGKHKSWYFQVKSKSLCDWRSVSL
jgi:hypothetical protein